MPIYEYRCGACGHHVEALQKMSEAPLRKCPDCGKSQLRRLVSAPQFRLKGEGWYETDFKSKNETKRNLVGGESGEGEAKSESGADAQKSPEAKDGAGAKSDSTESAAKPKADAVKADARAKKPLPKSRSRRSARR